MKTTIYMILQYGGYECSFKKVYDLPFMPYYDLVITDNDLNIHLTRNENFGLYCFIYFDVNKNKCIIDKRTYFQRLPSIEAIEQEIEDYLNMGFFTESIERIKNFKDFIKEQIRQYETHKKS